MLFRAVRMTVCFHKPPQSTFADRIRLVFRSAEFVSKLSHIYLDSSSLPLGGTFRKTLRFRDPQDVALPFFSLLLACVPTQANIIDGFKSPSSFVIKLWDKWDYNTKVKRLDHSQQSGPHSYSDLLITSSPLS